MNSVLEEINRRNMAAAKIQEVLALHGAHVRVDPSRIHLRPKTIVEHTSERRISDAVLDNMFHKIKGPIVLYHYTSRGGLRSILNSRELRLFSLYKRIAEGELRTFAEDHALEGYLDQHEVGGGPMYKTLAKDLFYCSLTELGKGDEGTLWSEFASGGTGVRLSFRLSPRYAELRSITYSANGKTLLTELNEALVAAVGIPFTPWRISRAGAFYLPSDFIDEAEVRLLLKRHEGGRNDAKTSGAYEYWPVPIDQENDVCLVELIGVEAGPNANRAAVEDDIVRSGCSAELLV